MELKSCLQKKKKKKNAKRTLKSASQTGILFEERRFTQDQRFACTLLSLNCISASDRTVESRKVKR